MFRKKEKLTAIDYIVMFGAPIAFLLITYFWLSALLGPPIPPNAVDLLRTGTVRIGMTAQQVHRLVGPPRGIEPRADGGQTYHYHRGSAEPFVEEEAFVDFNEAGVVVGIRFERVVVPVPGNG
jgi:hypothetical protein